MCGIFGSISKVPKKFNKRAFAVIGSDNDSRGGDSCGLFVDGDVEYGVDQNKKFIDFFVTSKLFNNTNTCKIALGHCRKASVGKIALETAQPVVIYNDQGKVDYVLIHNGTIHNYENLAKKYIPDIDIKGLTDSQVMARIFYYKGYDCLSEYIGGAVFVMHDYRINRTLAFKGASKKYHSSKEIEEERPLYFCWHNDRFCFSSILNSLYTFYYEEEIYTFPVNKLIVIKKNKLGLLKEYSRENVTQQKPIIVKTSTYTYNWYKINFHDDLYYDNKNQLMHGIVLLSEYGFVYPLGNEDKSRFKVGFFQGRMLKHPEAFEFINKVYNNSKQKLTTTVKNLINILDFNPFSTKDDNYLFHDGKSLFFYPQGEWKFPMSNKAKIFDLYGKCLSEKPNYYDSWSGDYLRYEWDKDAIIKLLKDYDTSGDNIS